DSDLPTHYGFKVGSDRQRLQAEFDRVSRGKKAETRGTSVKTLAKNAARVVSELDAEGRWITSHDGKPLVGQPKLKPGEQFISSRVFCQNLRRLGDYVMAAHRNER
ncbi:MAG: hypothetical protein KDA85_01690, partial [Planctomycetaceae bacterium]|nr:hypothetical protein [Planctomycetaceae bacterium]